MQAVMSLLSQLSPTATAAAAETLSPIKASASLHPASPREEATLGGGNTAGAPAQDSLALVAGSLVAEVSLAVHSLLQSILLHNKAGKMLGSQAEQVRPMLSLLVPLLVLLLVLLLAVLVLTPLPCRRRPPPPEAALLTSTSSSAASPPATPPSR